MCEWSCVSSGAIKIKYIKARSKKSVTFYVSDEGSDNSGKPMPGSENNPYRTIHAALDATACWTWDKDYVRRRKGRRKHI